jgi:hypothetical protein
MVARLITSLPAVGTSAKDSGNLPEICERPLMAQPTPFSRRPLSRAFLPFHRDRGRARIRPNPKFKLPGMGMHPDQVRGGVSKDAPAARASLQPTGLT